MRVWQLGAEGWRLCEREGRYIPARAIHAHTLAIADLHVELVKLARSGRLVIRVYQTEPDAHRIIKAGSVEYHVKPDFYVEVSRVGEARILPMMFEIDQASQRQPVIIEKMLRYWNAVQVETADSTAGQPRYYMPENLIVVFIAIDEARATELRWILSKASEEQRKLFRVYTLASFIAQF